MRSYLPVPCSSHLVRGIGRIFNGMRRPGPTCLLAPVRGAVSRVRAARPPTLNLKKPKSKPTPAAVMWAAVWERSRRRRDPGCGAMWRPSPMSWSRRCPVATGGRKKAAGRGFVVLGETAGDILGEQVDKIVDGLLGALSGRLWEGKEVLLESLASLVINGRQAMSHERIDKAVEALLEASQKKTVAFNTVAFVQLGRVGKALGDVARRMCARRLLPQSLARACRDLKDEVLDVGDTKPDAKPEATARTPLAVIIHCVASFWVGNTVATRDPVMSSITIEVLTPVLRTRCEKVDDQKAVLQALWEVVNGRNGDLGGQSTISLADALAIVTVSGKAEHNRLLAGDILLKLAKNQRGSDVGKPPAWLAAVANTLHAHRDKSAAVRARIDDILRLLT